MVRRLWNKVSIQYKSDQLLDIAEMMLTLVVLVVILTYVYSWSQTMASHSLWTDEIYTISNFSSKGPIVTLTDYHAPNNHIFFNFVNSLFPGADSYDPLRARIVSIVSVYCSLIAIVWFFFRQSWFFAAALAAFALTNSWTHMDSMMQARGYGIAVLCVVILAFSTYLYIIERKSVWMVWMLVASVIGIWTVPTFGFFALPMNCLVAFTVREKKLIFGLLLSYCAVAALYAPLMLVMLRINAAYTGQGWAEFGSFDAVFTTLRDYLFSDSSKALISLFGICTALIVLFPWKKLGFGSKVSPFRIISASIWLFFIICLLLTTPAIRSVAFVVVPFFLVLISVSYVLIEHFRIGKYLKIVLFPVIAFFIYGDIAEKNKVLDMYYVPHENWMEVAAVVRQIFPPDQVSVFNSRGTGYLQKYLPSNYTMRDAFNEHEFVTKQQVVIDGDYKKKESLKGRTILLPHSQ